MIGIGWYKKSKCDKKVFKYMEDYKRAIFVPPTGGGMEITMTKVYFVRHAEPNYNNHNDNLRELSSKGMEDRKLVTKFLVDKQIDVVLSSPYKRAVDTVKEFADNGKNGIVIINKWQTILGKLYIQRFFSLKIHLYNLINQKKPYQHLNKL